MSHALTIVMSERAPALPAIITSEGRKATKRFLEFFTANIRNPNTRLSYMRATSAFLAWCEERGASLHQIEPVLVAAYIEQLTQERAPQTVKQHLAAIRMLFDWLVTGQVVPFNPAASVRGPRYSIKKGKTPVLSAQETRKLLDSIDTSHVVGLRDRAQDRAEAKDEGERGNTREQAGTTHAEISFDEAQDRAQGTHSSQRTSPF